MGQELDFTKTKDCLQCGSKMGGVVVKDVKKETFVRLLLVAAGIRTGQTNPISTQGVEVFACQDCGLIQFYGIIAK